MSGWPRSLKFITYYLPCSRLFLFSLEGWTSAIDLLPVFVLDLFGAGTSNDCQVGPYVASCKVGEDRWQPCRMVVWLTVITRALIPT